MTITSIVLAANGALGPAIEQIFGGSSSKGSWSELLVGFLARMEAAPTLELLMLILLVAALFQTAGPLRSGGDQRASAIIVASWFLAIGVFVVVRRVPITFVDIDLFRAQRQLLIYTAFFLVAVYCVNAAIRASRAPGTDQFAKLLVGGTTFVIMYVHGMSGSLEDHAMLLSGALLIGIALSAATVWPRLRDGVIYGAAAVLIFTITVQRNERPYFWWGINNLPATWDATATFDDPLLVGIKSSPSYTRQMNAIRDVILANKRPGDTMYAFPHLNYFNVMSGLPSPTFGKVDFFDVAPDALARRDAKLLMEHSPTFLIWMQLAPAAWSVNEERFRGGQPSGQRDLQKTFDRLVSSGAYVSLGRFELGDSDPIDISMQLRAGS